MKAALMIALLCSAAVFGPGYADTQKMLLRCDLQVTTQASTGELKQSHETAQVELLSDEASGFKAITVHSAAIPVAVANKKGGAVTSFVDGSDVQHWDIANRRDRSKVASEERVALDRQTHRIIASATTTVGDASQHVEARGHCSAIDSH